MQRRHGVLFGALILHGSRRLPASPGNRAGPGHTRPRVRGHGGSRKRHGECRRRASSGPAPIGQGKRQGTRRPHAGLDVPLRFPRGRGSDLGVVRSARLPHFFGWGSVSISPTSSWVVVLRSLCVGRFLTRLKSNNTNRDALDVCQTCFRRGFKLLN